MRWGLPAALIVVGLLLKVALSPVDETLGSWVGGAVAVGGVVVVPFVEWLRSRRVDDERLRESTD